MFYYYNAASLSTNSQEYLCRCFNLEDNWQKNSTLLNYEEAINY